MKIVTYMATVPSLPTADLMFLAILVDAHEFHPVTPFRSALSAEDAAAKAQAWWDDQLAAFAKTEAGRAARAAAVSAAARKRAKGAEPTEPEESF